MVVAAVVVVGAHLRVVPLVAFTNMTQAASVAHLLVGTVPFVMRAVAVMAPEQPSLHMAVGTMDFLGRPMRLAGVRFLPLPASLHTFHVCVGALLWGPVVWAACALVLSRVFWCCQAAVAVVDEGVAVEADAVGLTMEDPGSGNRRRPQRRRKARLVDTGSAVAAAEVARAVAAAVAVVAAAHAAQQPTCFLAR